MNDPLYLLGYAICCLFGLLVMITYDEVLGAWISGISFGMSFGMIIHGNKGS